MRRKENCEKVTTLKRCTSAGSLINMNDYQGKVRKRSKNLLIVEGHHEKNKLFWLIFKCFPEININMDEIWIYGTN